MLAIVAVTSYSGRPVSGKVDGVLDGLAETVAGQHLVCFVGDRSIVNKAYFANRGEKRGGDLLSRQSRGRVHIGWPGSS